MPKKGGPVHQTRRVGKRHLDRARGEKFGAICGRLVALEVGKKGNSQKKNRPLQELRKENSIKARSERGGGVNKPRNRPGGTIRSPIRWREAGTGDAERGSLLMREEGAAIKRVTILTRPSVFKACRSQPENTEPYPSCNCIRHDAEERGLEGKNSNANLGSTGLG